MKPYFSYTKGAHSLLDKKKLMDFKKGRHFLKHFPYAKLKKIIVDAAASFKLSFKLWSIEWGKNLENHVNFSEIQNCLK